MMIFIHLLGVFLRYHRYRPLGRYLFNRTNPLQNLNKSYHKNQFKQLH